MPRRGAHDREAAGFTIIEIVVVVALLVVAAGLIIPRLGSRDGMLAEGEVRAIASLMQAASRRSATTAQLASLVYRDEGRRISVEVAHAEDPSVFGGQVVWRESALEPALALQWVRVIGGQSAGMPLDSRQWRIDFDPSDSGPEVVLLIHALEDDRRWTLSMPWGSTSARIALGEEASASAGVIDLDANGQRESTW
jgi:type II secretory pathway pseudopilin PulG